MTQPISPELPAEWYELEQIFATAPIGLVVLDHELRYQRVNKTLADMVRLTPEAMVGKTVADLFPAHIGTVGPVMRKVLETGEPHFNVERNMKFEEGMLSLLSSYIPVRDAKGVIVSLCIVAYETTDLMLAELQLRKARDAAEAASRAKDRFLAVLSHELRTPLTPALATIAALQKRVDLPADVQEDLATCRRNVELESRLIDDLLDLTRISQGKVVLRHEPSDLNQLIRHAVDICRDDIDAKQLSLKIELAETRPSIQGDPARLQQIFWNLIKNAVKFTPEGGAVSIRSRVADGKMTIEFRDSGIGIDREMLPRLFTAFEQGEVKITRQFGGLGLGLTISRALLDLHGGTITAASPGVNLGSTFTVTLPVKADAVVRAPAAPASPVSPVVTAGRLLLVEDHPDTLRVMSRLIRAMGYTVDTATNVADAVTKARADRFDLLISDIGLPDGSGMDVMRQIDHLPAIAVSGFGMPEDLDKSREAGFARHMVKPIDVDELKRAIGALLASR